MDWTMILGILGSLGAVGGVVSAWYARGSKIEAQRANARADAMVVEAKRANAIAERATQEAVAANVHSQRAVELESIRSKESSSARLVLEDFHIQTDTVNPPTANFIIMNQGQAPATILGWRWLGEDGKEHHKHTTNNRMLAPSATVPVREERVYVQSRGPGGRFDTQLTVEYRDGNGDHELVIRHVTGHVRRKDGLATPASVLLSARLDGRDYPLMMPGRFVQSIT